MTNPFHECTAWCVEHWGVAEGPLPPGWKAVIEKASGDRYYWNTVTGKTSWLRPAPPAASDASLPEPAASASGTDPEPRDDLEP